MLISAAALVFGINILTSLIKRWVYPTFGAFGVQVVAFALAMIGTLYVLYGGQYPGLVQLVAAAGLIFSTAVTFYEVILQHIPAFQGPALEDSQG